MMNSLLASVSASALMAAGGPPPVFDGVTATLTDSIATSANNNQPTLSFPSVGAYMVCLWGASGGAGGSDSPITITGIGGFEYSQIITAESNDYEEITWAWVFVTTPGNYQISHTFSGTSYRRGAVNFLLSGNADYTNATWFWARNSGWSADLTVTDKSKVLATMVSRGGTINMSGMDPLVASTSYEGTDIYALFEKSITANGILSIADTSSGTTSSRLLMAGILIPILPDNEILDNSHTLAVINGFQDRVAIRRNTPYVILGSNPQGPTVRRSQTYVILE